MNETMERWIQWKWKQNKTGGQETKTTGKDKKSRKVTNGNRNQKKTEVSRKRKEEDQERKVMIKPCKNSDIGKEIENGIIRKR